jgi:hypothetical protein
LALPKDLHLARLAILLGVLLSCGSGCRERVDPVVAEMARAVQRVPPANGLRIAAARGEGRTLILQVEADSETAQALDAAGIAHIFAAGFCATRRDANFFSEGRALRIELFTPGRVATNATVTRCSGPTGQGLNTATFVEMLRPMVGRDLGDGAKLTSVRADGQTLVMVMDGPTGWRTGLDQATIAWVLLEDACSRPGGFRLFDGTHKLRLDTTEGGNNLIQGQVIGHCPAPPVARP